MKSGLVNKQQEFIQQLAAVLLSVTFLYGCSEKGENPGLVDTPLVYAKRTIPVDDEGIPQQYDVRDPVDPMLFSEGGDVYFRTTTSASVAEKNISRSVTLGTGDVRDVDVSYDAEKVLFSLRLVDADPNDDIVPKWGIYEYEFATDILRRIIASDLKAGEGNDIAPAYLPDGRIVFSSDRQVQSRAMLLDEVGDRIGYSAIVEQNNGAKALVLHVMEADGSNIHQITFNQSHDLDPVVMPDGRILFSRWDGAGSNDSINLYTVNPDGSDLQLYYGDNAASHVDANGDTMHMTQPTIMQDGRVLVLARPFTDSYAGGDLIIINGAAYIENNQPIFSNMGVLSGPGQEKATVTAVTNSELSRAGRYSSAYPLLDGSNRLIVSKGTCQITNDDIEDPDIIVTVHPCVEPYISRLPVTEMPYSYGLWIYDMNNNTERPIIRAESGYILTDVVVAQKRAVPTVIADKGFSDLDQSLIAQSVGILDIRSVYDMGNASFTCGFGTITCSFATLAALSDPLVPADQHPARFLRLIKPVSLPDPDDPDFDDLPDLDGTAFGRNRALGMREIIGYTMIEPDGSVRVKVPANIAFGIEVLDKNGMRLGARHDNWLQVKAGDTLKCNGCHAVTTGVTPLPHGRANAQASSINSGAPYDGYVYTNTQVPDTTSVYFGDYADTLAQVRTRTNPDALNPSADIVYEDAWTDPAARTPDTAFSYSYSDLTTDSPVPPGTCSTTWSGFCRVVINYGEQTLTDTPGDVHIQPIWEFNRGANTCITCHNTKDAMNNDQVPAGQLDLTGGASVDNAQHLVSYRELFFDDNLQELVNGAIVDVLVTVPVLDDNGNQLIIDSVPQFTQEPVTNPNGPVMNAGGARANYFIEKMMNTELNATRALTGTTNHTGFLTNAELRLIAEWLDLGGQNFNNPLDPDAPLN